MKWPPVPQSETPPKGHFSSRQPQSWDQQRPHINVRKFNVSSVHCCSPTHFPLRTDFLQALCVSGNPAWNTLKSLERTRKKEESQLWEKKRQTQYRILVKGVISTSCQSSTLSKVSVWSWVIHPFNMSRCFAFQLHKPSQVCHYPSLLMRYYTVKHFPSI